MHFKIDLQISLASELLLSNQFTFFAIESAKPKSRCGRFPLVFQASLFDIGLRSQKPATALHQKYQIR